MTPVVDWIAAHALLLWLLLLLLALLGGDLAWHYNARWHRNTIARGGAAKVLRWQVGLPLLLMLIALFGAIALVVSTQQTSRLLRFDTTLAESLRAHLSIGVLRGIAMLTQLGSLLWITSLAIAVAAVLLLRRHWQLAGIWAITLLGILPLTDNLKAYFHRVRPLQDHGFIIERGWSFPSGHAFGSMVCYGMLAYVLLRLLPPRWHRLVIACAVLLVSMIGISRILLQVHYFSDVIAGYVAGATWLVLCLAIAEYLREPPKITRAIDHD